MFRSMRFRYFLTNSYRKLSGVYSKNALLNANRVVPTSNKINATHKLQVDYPLYSFEEEIPETEFLETLTKSYWNSLLAEDTSDLDWDKYLTSEEMPKEPGVNVYAVILLLCKDKRFDKCAISFFNYLYEKRELTAGLLCLFLSTIMERPQNFESCQDLIFHIFQNTLYTDKISAKACSRILLLMPKYSNLVYEPYKIHMADNKNHSVVIMGLIKANKLNEALDLYKKGGQKLFSIEEYLLNACYTNIIEVNSTLSDMYELINDLFKIDPETFATDEYMNFLSSLFRQLAQVDKEYTWFINKGKLPADSCPFCNRLLKLTDVSEKEIEILLKDMEPNVVVQDTIFLKSNIEEWKTFCEFVQDNDYNLVMDGLNVKYAINNYERFCKFMREVTDYGFTPFIMGKKYFTNFPEYKLVKSQFPVFMTDSLSDDDVFVLYAALKKGKSCYFVSNDKMRFCNRLLSSPETLDIFNRWKASHQCHVSCRRELLLPSMIENKLHLYQNSQDGEFSHHYVYMDEFGQFVTCISRMKKNFSKRLAKE